MKSLLKRFAGRSNISRSRRPNRRFQPHFQALESRRLIAADCSIEPPGADQVDSDQIIVSELRIERTNDAEDRLQRALDQPASLSFEDTPLLEVVDSIGEEFGIIIVLPENAEGDPNPLDTVNFRSTNFSLRSALKSMLDDMDLQYVVKNEVLQITSQEIQETHLTTKVYPVGDLVVPIQTGGPIAGGIGSMGGGLGG